MKKLEDLVRVVPDFPKPGISFKDVTTVLQDADGLQMAVDAMCDMVKDIDVDVIAGAEARGFVFASAMAYKLHKPLVLVRKKGKLPFETVSETYDLEYGTASIEIHKDAIAPGQKVLLVDDLIATGGTLAASERLINKLGGKTVAVAVLMELEGLCGRDLFECPVYSVLKYPDK